ncbi:hypothetical protein BH20VER2_BH20VER2_03910 [soil metagenome]
MRTTIDIPDEIFKNAKLEAVHQGVPLKEVITRALAREFGKSSDVVSQRNARARRLFSALDKARNVRPVGRLKREKLHDRPVLR